MIILDSNYILRYLLNDNREMFLVAQEVIEKENCLVLNEVIAEVVYVLEGVYGVPKETLSQTISEFIMSYHIALNMEKEVLLSALSIFRSKNLDFVDCYLCALKERYEIKTFDKKLQKCLADAAK
jgi:predicted nucleic-acid-binding protein